jgi:chorismate lyase/3-hydroxybenzoate synthase
MAILDSRYRKPSGPFEISFEPASRLVDDYFNEWRQPLAVIQYGEWEQLPLSVECPSLCIPVPQLNKETLVEIWTSSTPVATGEQDGIAYAANDQALVGVFRLAESPGQLVDVITHNAYSDILRFVKQKGYPDLLRVWNYLSDINDQQDDLERYRRFCIGRFNAFSEFGTGFEQALRAATAAGLHSPGLFIYFLAARGTSQPIENPRQLNPYHYPPQYSPRSPSFSRAVVKDWGPHRQLFISGTGSIVEHQSLHAGDVAAQLTEILRNIDTLVQHAASVSGTDFRDKCTTSIFKAYLRHAADLPLIREHLPHALGEGTPVLLLNADLCRKELLMEIEGMYSQPV